MDIMPRADMFTRRQPHSPASFGVVQQGHESVREGGGVAFRRQNGRFIGPDHSPNAGAVPQDGGKSQCLCFQRREAKGLSNGGPCEKIGSAR